MCLQHQGIPIFNPKRKRWATSTPQGAAQAQRASPKAFRCGLTPSPSPACHQLEKGPDWPVGYLLQVDDEHCAHFGFKVSPSPPAMAPQGSKIKILKPPRLRREYREHAPSKCARSKPGGAQKKRFSQGALAVEEASVRIKPLRAAAKGVGGILFFACFYLLAPLFPC